MQCAACESRKFELLSVSRLKTWEKRICHTSQLNTCFCSLFLLFWNLGNSKFPSMLPVWNSRMVTWITKCQLGLFWEVIGCKLISWLTVSANTTIYPLLQCYVVIVSDVSLSEHFDWQSRLTVICRGGPMKAAVGWPCSFLFFLFSVFFSTEPIREEISKQIAAACSVWWCPQVWSCEISLKQ